MNKILFVEDDPDQIMIYDFKFKQQGLILFVAANKKETLESLSRDRPELILLDLLLKNENGLDILEEVRKEESFRDIPVIIFTNFDREDVRMRADELGAIDYIIKAQIYPQEMTDKIKVFFETGRYIKGLKR